MKLLILWIIIICLTACGKMETSTSETADPSNGEVALKLIETIPLQGVEGRIDHLAIDLKAQRLFVAALGNNTVEIVDLTAGKVTHSISGLDEPQGIVFVPEFNKIFVANGGNGICEIFDSDTFQKIGQLNLSGDADNIRYNAISKTVYVGYGNGGLSLIEASTNKVIGDIKLNGHPESFQLDLSDARILVNIPSANQIAVVDSQKQKVIATWLLTNAVANYPMALDENQHRLFVGTRFPAKLNIYDSQTGKQVAGLDSVGDADDIFYDTDHKEIFLIGGEGYVDLFSQEDADHYELATRVSTASGARTGLWVSELNQLYIAVPHRGSQEAEIRVYKLQP